MKTKNELIAEYRSILAKQKQVNERVLAESRNYTTAEDAEYRQATARLDSIATLLERMGDQSEAERRLTETEGGNRGGRPAFLGDGLFGSSNTRDQVRTPYLRSDESYAQRIADEIPSEERDLSLAKCLRGAAIGDWKHAEREKRAMSTSSSGYTLPRWVVAQIVDLARAKSVIANAGARVMPLQPGETKVPVLLTDPTSHWKEENAAIISSDSTFGAVTLEPKTLVAMAKLSVELVEDGGEILESFVQAMFGRVLALAWDKAALMGNPSVDTESPRGVMYWPGVPATTLGTGDGAAITGFDPFVAAIGALRTANHEPSALIWHPRTLTTVEGLKDTTNQPLQPPASFERLRKLDTTALPIDQEVGDSEDCTSVIVGDWSNLVLGVRGELRFEVSRQAADGSSSAYSNLQYWVRAYLRGDVAVIRPNAFRIIKGITA